VTPRFLAAAHVDAIHERMLTDHGGSQGTRDAGGLASAIAMPRQTFGGEFLHEFPFEMAAAYAFHLAESQAFVDGNKRTGATAALVFLDLHGWDCGAGPWLADALLQVASGILDKRGLAALFEKQARRRSGE
jgi:death-on-curing protein